MPKNVPNSPPLAGKRVFLAPIAPADYGFLHALSMTDEALAVWRYRGATPSPEAFATSLWQDSLVSFIAMRTHDESPLGHVSAFKPDFRNGTVNMGLLLAPVPDRTIITHDVAVLFVNYLFHCWPFRKIYGDSSGSSAVSGFVPHWNDLLQEEGRLRDHEFFGGRYWDLVITAMYRDTWEPYIERVLPRISDEDLSV